MGQDIPRNQTDSRLYLEGKHTLNKEVIIGFIIIDPKNCAVVLVAVRACSST